MLPLQLQLQFQFQTHFRDVANSCYREPQNKERKFGILQVLDNHKIKTCKPIRRSKETENK